MAWGLLQLSAAALRAGFAPVGGTQGRPMGLQTGSSGAMTAGGTAAGARAEANLQNLNIG